VAESADPPAAFGLEASAGIVSSGSTGGGVEGVGDGAGVGSEAQPASRASAATAERRRVIMAAARHHGRRERSTVRRDGPATTRAAARSGPEPEEAPARADW
jgi:hypothetical protein